MVVAATCLKYGHRATFFSSQATVTNRNDVKWARSEIYVPSSSCLNGPAEVWFRIPGINLQSAKQWCEKSSITYLGPWISQQTSKIHGFGFRVSGFSRYRFMEVDNENDTTTNTDNQVEEDESQTNQPEGQRIFVRDAGRTPARRKLSNTDHRQSLSTYQHGAPYSNVPTVKKEEPVVSARPQFSAPALLDDEVDEDDDDGASGSTPADVDEETDPENMTMQQADDEFSFRDPFRSSTRRHEPFVDAPKVHAVRAALFEDLPMYATPNKRESSRIHPSFAQATPGGDIIMREQEEEQYNMFDEDPDEKEPNELDNISLGEETGITSSIAPSENPYSHTAFPVRSLPFPVLSDSIAAGMEGAFKDNGLLLGRSTRISFSQAGVIVGSRFGAAKFDGGLQSSFTAEVCNFYEVTTPIEKANVADLLRTHCIAWDIYRMDKNKLRKDEITKNMNNTIIEAPTLTDCFTDPLVANNIVEDIITELEKCQDRGDPNARHAHIAFSMLSALYKFEDGDLFDESDNLLERVAKWGAGPAGIAFDEINPESKSLRKALLKLCIGNVEEAVDIAIEEGHPRLAMLISRSLEAPKDDLRKDAIAQLSAYGLVIGNPNDEDKRDGRFRTRWDRILHNCEDTAQVSVDERMIFLVLAGYVAPVARFLDFSWYRLFIMEFLHGKGSSELSFGERVASAVSAIADSDISTQAPHGRADQIDVVYHLLRLYAEPSGKYPLTSGLYSVGSFGEIYTPLDSRFTWLLHQVLTALIPQASPQNASGMLADSFSSQLRAMGMPLWSFYVLCSGSPSPQMLKNALIKDWPDMENDLVHVHPNSEELSSNMKTTKGGNSSTSNGVMEDADNPVVGNEMDDEKEFMDAETFLTRIVGVPSSWLSEAKAYAAHFAGEHLDECEYWMACQTEEGDLRAHDLLLKEIIPEAIVTQESTKYATITALLKDLKSSKHIPDWNTAGGFVLNYFEYVVGVPQLKTGTQSFFREMVHQGCVFADKANSATQKHAACLMADGVAMVQRAQLLLDSQERSEAAMTPFVDDLQKLPCSRGVKLSLAGEYKIEAKHGRAIALRFAAAYPPYLKYLQRSKHEIR